MKKNTHPYRDLPICTRYFFKPRQTDDANENRSNIITEGEMIVNVLIEFWLSESDISVDRGICTTDDNLVNAVTLLVSYLGERIQFSCIFAHERSIEASVI